MHHEVMNLTTSCANCVLSSFPILKNATTTNKEHQH